jgi:hypothetical protein
MSKGRKVVGGRRESGRRGDAAMTGHDTLEQLERQAIVALAPEQLGELLQSAETVREVNTCLSGWLRILSIAGTALIQEQTPEGEFLVRSMPSIEDAECFVERRLATYERMWDGCGCTIDYHE